MYMSIGICVQNCPKIYEEYSLLDPPTRHAQQQRWSYIVVGVGTPPLEQSATRPDVKLKHHTRRRMRLAKSERDYY